MQPPTAAVTTHAPRHIPELDGIRGIAALAVLLHHVCSATVHVDLQTGWPASIRAVWAITELGNNGVDLFFVLSGFLISTILLKDRRSDRYYQDFYWKRVLRIIPLYLFCLILMFILERNVAYTAFAAVFLVNFASVFHVQGVSPFWTLSIEEQFYVLWPTVVRRKTVEQVRKWAIIMALSAVILRPLFALRGHHNYYLTFLHWDPLACGALLACHFHVASDNHQRRHSWDFPLAISGAVGLVLFAVMYHYLPRPMAHAWLQTSVTLITVAIIGLSISFSGASVLAPLRSRVMVFFGLISYALYMLHLFVLNAYDHHFGELRPGDVSGYWIRLVVLLSLSIAAALLSRHILELPAMRLRRFVLKYPNPKAEQQHPPLPLAPM